MQLSALSRLSTLILLLCAGCADDFTGVDPPADARLYYPGRLTKTADESTVYIVNVNFDQRFNASWISVLDTNALLTALDQNTDAKVAIDPNRSLKVPMLASNLVLDPNRNRAYLTSRGTGMLTTLDVDADNNLTCGDNNDDTGLAYDLRRTDCAASHLFDFTQNAAPNDPGNNNRATNFADPFALTLIPDSPTKDGMPDTLLAVGFMSSQYVAIMDPTVTEARPKYLRVNGLGNTATLSMAPGLKPGWFVAGNHVVNSGTDRGVLYFVDAVNSVLKGADLTQTYVLGNDTGSFELSDVTRVDDRLYIASRGPDAVATVTLGPGDSYSKQILTGASGVASSLPTAVRYLPRAGGDDLVALNSVQQDSVFFFSITGGRLQMVQRVALAPGGQGPYDMQRITRNGRDLLLVSTFFDHGISIIDITPTQTSQFKVVATIHQGDLGVASRFR